MVRPCDGCGGSEEVHCSETGCVQHGTDNHSMVPCSACKDMPWLDWREFGTWVWNKFVPLDGPEWYSNHESRKPDPSTVMRWCQAHEASVLRNEETCWPVTIATMDGLDTNDCDIVWVERPTALKEAT